MATLHSSSGDEKVLGRLAFCNKDDLRTNFALAMSTLYQQEVPLYGTLIDVTNQVNNHIAESEAFVLAERLHLERHGAIRLGTPYELQVVRRIFALIGLYPVDYYDLSVAGLPMHATAFRPVDGAALRKNPFRVFTTLLRLELLSVQSRDLAISLLHRRNIFSHELLRLLDTAETQGGLTTEQGETFVIEALRTFRWQSVAAATHEEYQALKDEHPILADVVCFNSAHINHLTPRVLDIVLAEEKMKAAGLNVKDAIEGPPLRKNPILLRQTSFLALQEDIMFPTDFGHLIGGSHKARFGEIEQRGAALTAKGRELYDTVLRRALQADHKVGSEAFRRKFQDFPDDFEELLRCGLIFCTLDVPRGWAAPERDIAEEAATASSLLASGRLKATPITYEDFLPFSAAGIFRSNLHSATQTDVNCSFEGFEDRSGFEGALGCPVYDSEKLYALEQARSLEISAKRLGLTEIVVHGDADA